MCVSIYLILFMNRFDFFLGTMEKKYEQQDNHKLQQILSII